MEAESSSPEVGLVGGEGDSLRTKGTNRSGEAASVATEGGGMAEMGTSIGGPRMGKEGGWLEGGVENQILL
jgi:hypothetical protein